MAVAYLPVSCRWGTDLSRGTGASRLFPDRDVSEKGRCGGEGASEGEGSERRGDGSEGGEGDERRGRRSGGGVEEEWRSSGRFGGRDTVATVCSGGLV